MAAITAAVNRAFRGVGKDHIEEYPMDASAGTIPKGAGVCLDATGYAVNGADTADYVYVGICIETVTFSGSADGDTNVKVDCTEGKWWKFTHGTGDLAVTDVGSILHLADNDNVDDATACSKDVRVGTMAKYISATECWVRQDFHDPIGDA